MCVYVSFIMAALGQDLVVPSEEEGANIHHTVDRKVFCFIFVDRILVVDPDHILHAVEGVPQGAAIYL